MTATPAGRVLLVEDDATVDEVIDDRFELSRAQAGAIRLELERLSLTARSFVEAHHGRIIVRNDGRGACFTVWLPTTLER